MPDIPKAPFPVEPITSKCRNNSNEKVLNGVTIKEILGSGTFSKVKHCIDTSGDSYAVKMFKKFVLVRKREFRNDGLKMVVITALDKVYNEVSLQLKLDHPNIVKILRILEDEDKCKMYVILELMKGGPILYLDGKTFEYKHSLKDTAAKDTNVLMDKKLIFQVLRDVGSALEYLHSRGIIHRDVKPGNILWSDEAKTTAKLADFTVAQQCPPSISAQSPSNLFDFSLGDTQGTYAFLPPECCSSVDFNLNDIEDENQPQEQDNSVTDGRAADMWALGVTAFVMATGRLPTPILPLEGMLAFFVRLSKAEPTEQLSGLEGWLNKVLRGLLCRDLQGRWTARMLLDELKMVEKSVMITSKVE